LEHRFLNKMIKCPLAVRFHLRRKRRRHPKSRQHNQKFTCTVHPALWLDKQLSLRFMLKC